ncbi:MAG: DUF952 domain-containing protein [Marinicaulis sp.]|nr:DUF952 domain-containing protein [Marinicaulis sp.]
MAHKTGDYFIYRLATRTEWVAAEETGVVPTRDIDRRDGYIHLSTRAQVLKTAALHFARSDDLVALEINAETLGDELKFELAPKRGEKFPHYYGALRKDHITRAIALTRDGAEFSFGEVI